MLQNLMALVPAAVGMRGGSRFARNDQSDGEEPLQTDLDKWIWIGEPEPATNSYIQARKTFSLRAKPTSALLKASADSRYEIYVNGTYVGKGPVRSPEGYSYFDTYDVAGLLKRGNNVIAVMAHHLGIDTYGCPARKPGLICKAEIEVSGETKCWETDETWKVRRAVERAPGGRRISKQLGFQEIYDAASASDGWTEIKFSEKGWEAAAIVGTAPAMPWGDLYEREIPQLREETVLPHAVLRQANSPELSKEVSAAEMPEIMAKAELSALKAGSVKDAEMLLNEDGVTQVKTPRGDRGVVMILDFGREVFGNVEVGLAGGSGTIDIGYSEQLVDDKVDPTKGDTAYTDRIVLKKGHIDWRSFEPRLFRYLQIEFRRCTKQIALEYIRVNQTTYPVEQTSTFECSDQDLNEIWKAGVYTTQLCMQDTFIDTPREGAQWWADARVASRTAFYAFNDTKLLAQGLRQIASSQIKDGSILGLYPSGENMLVPDYALLWVFSILDYYAFSEDESVVSELYPVVQRLLNWFSRYENESGLLSEVPGGLAIDRADLERAGEVTSLNCFYAQALRVAAVLAMISGEQEQAEKYNDTANRVRVAINKFMYVPRKGLYAECRTNGALVEKFSRQTNILAALFDIADQYQKASIFRQLSGAALPEITTPYFGSYYLEALYASDMHAKAIDYMRGKWGAMLKAGATTLWEDFGSERSKCHGSAVCPVRDLLAEIVGIKPVLGSHRFSITPHTANLRWAKGSIATSFGPLNVDWRFFRARLDLSVQVPEGLRVDVYPPGPVDSTITVDGKRWPTRVVTLSGGKHEIRVTAPKPTKIIATYDESATPLMPHVEVLDRGIRVSRGRPVVLEPRKRSKRGAQQPAEPLEVRMDAATIGEESEIEEQVELTQPAEITEEPTTRKRRRRSRGGRGRGRGATGEPVTVEATVETTNVECEETDVSEEAAVEPAVPEETTIKKKRRRRGGRGRGKSRVASETEQSEQTAPSEQPIETDIQPAEIAVEPSEGISQAAGQSEMQQAEGSEGAPTRKRRRRPRGGRGRGRSKAAAEAEQMPSGDVIPSEESAPLEAPAQVVEEPPTEPVAVEQPEQEAQEPQEKRRRRPRGGRGRGRSKARAEAEPTASEEPSAQAEAPTPSEVPEAQTAAEPSESAVTEQTAEEISAKPKRRSRGGRGRGKSTKVEAAEVSVEGHAAESVSEPALPSQDVPSASADVLYQAHPLSLPVSEPPAAEEAPVEKSEKPKRRRTYTRRRTTKKTEAADEVGPADEQQQ